MLVSMAFIPLPHAFSISNVFAILSHAWLNFARFSHDQTLLLDFSFGLAYSPLGDLSVRS